MAADTEVNVEKLQALAEQTCDRLGIPKKLEMRPVWRDAIIEAFSDVLKLSAEMARSAADYYPTDVFAADGQSPEAWAAKGCRLVSKNLTEDLQSLADALLMKQLQELASGGR